MNEWFVIICHESQYQRKRDYCRADNDSNCYWQEMKRQISEARSPGQVRKLLECQRSEHFVFNIDKLWNFELHIYPLSTGSWYGSIVARVGVFVILFISGADGVLFI